MASSIYFLLGVGGHFCEEMADFRYTVFRSVANLDTAVERYGAEFEVGGLPE